MQHSPAEILQALILQQSGLIYTLPADNLDWPLFLTVLPDGDAAPMNAAACIDTTGVKGPRMANRGRYVFKYGVQVLSRSVDYGEGFRNLSDAAKTLERVPPLTVIAISGNQYVVDTILRTSPVLSLGQDARRRAQHSVNFLLMLIESVS